MKKVLIAYAVEQEFTPITLKGCKVEYVKTGIGKAKAAMNLTAAICNNRPDIVINKGTAGTLTHAVGNIFVCRRFIDRDFQAVQLPGIDFELNFREELDADGLTRSWLSSNGLTGTCNTGDSFVTEAELIEGDVVDMEAFALAIVCKKFNLPFIAVKYVTDIIGQNSVKHWEDKLTDARGGLAQWFLDK
ncbi:nucleosidase [Dysgonomonas sp. 216]|uniref:5'-methylthioadenosine/S-adenosylhomocysteine nucleosidase family protein n=1 Tax=Dysgonomonas sp. 216 TaxID=2302934 RepID=UPI0013D18FCC|nr:5'-methylthioadenosine/S-adenosylhomocysteine nucleosidase [Dysgonomonas sp. 216]NDW18572.1 nucleosidase [Dysgonomonas sp. 216]